MAPCLDPFDWKIDSVSKPFMSMVCVALIFKSIMSYNKLLSIPYFKYLLIKKLCISESNAFAMSKRVQIR